MKKINEVYQRHERPIKVLQFGEGNFLRAFVDYAIDVANERGTFAGDVAIIKPRAGKLTDYHDQDNLYTVILQGIKAGEIYEEERVITCVQKVLGAYEDYDEFMELAKLESLEFVVSNTTEAGIVYQDSDLLTDCPPTAYPAKLTKFLYRRFCFFHGAADKGLVMLPVELNDDNGEKLKKCVCQYAQLWDLPAEFVQWLEQSNVFANTLVDRIVAGYPTAKMKALTKKWGYEDKLAVLGEPFGLWIIESAKNVAEHLSLDSEALTVQFTDQLKLYKEQKVRILNGAHTAFVFVGYLAGKDYVKECMEDPLVREYIERTVNQEIVPTVPLSQENAAAFAKFVMERFENPFVKHALLSIALNSVAKWRVRILPTLCDIYKRDGKLPSLLLFSFAALAAFYRQAKAVNTELVGTRGAAQYPVADDVAVLEFLREQLPQSDTDFMLALTRQKAFWGMDLAAELPGFAEQAAMYLQLILTKGMREALADVLARKS